MFKRKPKPMPNCDVMMSGKLGKRWHGRCNVCGRDNVVSEERKYCEDPFDESKNGNYWWMTCKRGHTFRLKEDPSLFGAHTTNPRIINFGMSNSTGDTFVLMPTTLVSTTRR